MDLVTRAVVDDGDGCSAFCRMLARKASKGLKAPSKVVVFFRKVKISNGSNGTSSSPSVVATVESSYSWSSKPGVGAASVCCEDLSDANVGHVMDTGPGDIEAEIDVVV